MTPLSEVQRILGVLKALGVRRQEYDLRSPWGPSWTTMPDGSTRVVNGPALIKRKAALFKWAQEAFK